MLARSKAIEKEYASDKSRILVFGLSLMNLRIFDVSLVNESSRNKVKPIISKV